MSLQVTPERSGSMNANSAIEIAQKIRKGGRMRCPHELIQLQRDGRWYCLLCGRRVTDVK